MHCFLHFQCHISRTVEIFWEKSVFINSINTIANINWGLTVCQVLYSILFFKLYWDTIDIQCCVSLRYMKWWFDVCIYCEMITTVRLVNTPITSDSYHLCMCECVYVVRLFKIYSLINFQVYNTVLWTIVNMWVHYSPELTPLLTIRLHHLTIFTHFSKHPPQALATPNLISVSVLFFFPHSTYKRDNTVFVFFYHT